MVLTFFTLQIIVLSMFLLIKNFTDLGYVVKFILLTFAKTEIFGLEAYQNV